MKYTVKETVRNMLLVILGSALFALGFDLFLEPAGFSCGGVTGISMLIVDAVDKKWLTVGILSAAINIPLFFLGYKQIGKFFFFGSMLGMVTNSVCFDLFAVLLPKPEVEPLMAAICGGLLTGAGLGIVFLAGASTGGVDIVARVLKLKARNMPIGKILLAMDLCIAVATGITYGAFSNTLYSAVALFVSSIILDRVVYSMDYSKVALIISDRHAQIAKSIGDQLHRGVTYLHGQGFYSGSEKMVMLSAVKRKQLAQLKELVNEIDPNAFIILQDAQQVLGDGFKRYDRFEL